MTKRALTYARVSYDDRPNEGRNLEGQVEDGQAYCQEKGYRIVAELAEDDRGASGASWDLPQLNKALEMARNGEFDVLVTRELDRFARKLAKQLVVEDQFKRYGVEIEYILGEYPDTPEGQLNKNIRAVVAEYERLKIEERMTRGRRRAVKNGKIMLHGIKVPPYGYRLEDDQFVIHEEEARIVRLIFTWYVCDDPAERLGIKSIVRKLTEMRIPTWVDVHGGGHKRSERGKWNKGTITLMLGNETYAGTWHYSKANGDAESRIPVEVPAIVSRELWEKAQERLERNKAMAKRNAKYDYLVGRRVTCGRCGCKMVGCSKRPKQKLYLYYTCRGYELSSKCEMTTYFRADQVDEAVWSWLRDLLTEPEQLRRRLEEERARQEETNGPMQDRLAVLDDLLTDNRRQLEKLLDLYLSGDFDREVLTDRKARLEATIAALEEERADLVATLKEQIITDAQIQEIEELAAFLDVAAADWVFEKRRKLIDDLDVQVTLTIEDDRKVAYVRCRIGEGVLSIEPTNTPIAFLANQSHLWYSEAHFTNPELFEKLAILSISKQTKMWYNSIV